MDSKGRGSLDRGVVKMRASFQDKLVGVLNRVLKSAGLEIVVFAVEHPVITDKPMQIRNVFSSMDSARQFLRSPKGRSCALMIALGNRP